MALREAAELPFGEFLGALCRELAMGQRALDQSAIATSLALARQRIPIGALGREADVDPGGVSPIELGLFPTFYQFVETVLDVRIDLRLGVRLGARGSGVTGRPIGPAYQASYGYQAAVASSLRARIVPVPPPPQAEQLLQSARAAADPAEPGDGTPER